MAERKHRGFVTTFATRLEEAGDEFMKAWRTQARRPDRVGEVSHRSLELVHGGVEFSLRSLNRLEHATQPPHRAARRHAQPPAVEAEAGKPARPAPARHAPAAPAVHHRPEHPEPKPTAS